MKRMINRIGVFHKMGYSARVSNDYRKSVNLKICLSLSEWIAKKGYCNPECSLRSLSNDFGVAEDHLICYFQENYKGGFRRFRTDLRIELAKKLLLSMPDAPFSRIAVLVGILDKTNFRRQFKENVGMTPDMWRRLHR